MKNFVTPHQNTIAQALDYQTAQLALSTLQKAGFPPEQFSVIPQTLDPNPSINETEAAKAAGMGATAGAVFGSLMGGLIGYGSILSTGTPSSLSHLIGLALAGSGVGALGASILGALTGGYVRNDKNVPASTVQYILVADITPEELRLAQELLQNSGIPTTPN